MKTQELFDLSGKVAIVTGGGTHLGRAMATSLGELGASVYIASRRRDLCEEVAEEMRSEGLDFTGLGCDVTDEQQVDELVEGEAQMQQEPLLKNPGLDIGVADGAQQDHDHARRGRVAEALKDAAFIEINQRGADEWYQDNLRRARIASIQRVFDHRSRRLGRHEEENYGEKDEEYGPA